MDNKGAIRSSMLECRKAIPPSQYAHLSRQIQLLFLASDIYREARTLMLYVPVHNEPGTALIIARAWRDHKTVLLPSVRNGRVCPVYYPKDAPLKQGHHKVQEPVAAQEYAGNEIDVVVVPGIAFDPRGNRIGYGKGYYDKFLGELDQRTIKAGFSFNRCLVEGIHANTWDIPVDMIVTETGIQIKEQIL